MDTKLYVGNLAYKTTEVDLQTLFGQAGVVKSVQIIKDRETDRSKGFGFVEMSSPSDAQKAITMFNGAQFQERTLTVNIARPREERGPRGGGGGGDRGGFGGGGGGDRRGGGRDSRGGGGRDRDDRRRSSWG